MDLEKLKCLAYKHMGNRKAHNYRERGYIYYHGQRTANLAVELRTQILPTDDSNDEIIMAAAFFHDIAKGIEPHSIYGAIIVKEILAQYCQAKELDLIVEMIRWHQFRDKTKDYSDYIKILQDADTLDHFGVLEIWTNFLYYAYQEGNIKDSVEFYQKQFDDLVGKIRKGLNYNVSLEIFDEKIHFIKNFVKRMEIEAQGRICPLSDSYSTFER